LRPVRAARIVPLACLLVAMASAPAQGVSDDALLAILSLSAWTEGDPPSAGGLQVQLERTDDAPDGPISGRVEFLVEDLDGVRPDQRIDASFTFEVGSTDPAHGGTWHDVQAEWSPGPGLYNVTATLWADGEEGPWDSHWTWQAVGRSPSLGTGWGQVRFPAASVFDLDSDGVGDLWLTDNATGAPANRSVDVYETVREGSQLAQWSPHCGRGLILEFLGPDVPVTDVRFAATAVESLVPGETPLRLDTQSEGGPPPPPVDGNYTVTLGAQYSGTRADAIFLARTCAAPPPRLPQTWGDGYRTMANVTHWDLDEDGAMDVRFWHTDATSVDEARNETAGQRRGDELLLIAQARVEQRTTRRLVTFELARPDGGHEGAWVEIQDAPGLFRELLAAPGNVTVRYSLSLPTNESFVELDGDTTWAWIGHFSVQTLTVILEETSADDMGSGSVGMDDLPADTDSSSSSPVPSGRGLPIPSPGIPLALAALGGAATALLPRRR
jgi:hypothetical protein